jgi:integrase
LSAGKPAKPYPEFPLFPHATKRWAKKIRGKLHYFGPWDDPEGAIAKYNAEKDALHAGLRPATNAEGLSVFLLCGRFLTSKKRVLESGELSVHSFNDYAKTCKRLLKHLDKKRLVVDLRPDDFERLRAWMTKRWGPNRVGNEINRIRIVFNYGVKSGLIEKTPVYGEGFKRPSKKVLRQHRAEQGPKMFEADEIRKMVAAARQPLKAMILLGANCGFGNSDCGTLPLSAIDLDRGWGNYPRPKTGIARRCPLWPETIAALQEWLRVRPNAKDKVNEGLMFLTGAGGTWTKNTADNPISREIRKLLDKLGIKGPRNFYCLRHTFQTIGDEARDFLAVRHIMGHVGADIADAYREKISDERLRAVAEHVRGWLFGQAKSEADEPPQKLAKQRTRKERARLRLFTA